MEDMYRSLNITIAKLANTSKSADVRVRGIPLLVEQRAWAFLEKDKTMENSLAGK